MTHGTTALLVFYGLDTIANIVSQNLCTPLVSNSQGGQTVAGHQVAWVNNQFQQYVYDVTDLVATPVHGNTNVTVAFESAWLYGLNVTARPDVEVQPIVVFAAVKDVEHLFPSLYQGNRDNKCIIKIHSGELSKYEGMKEVNRSN